MTTNQHVNPYNTIVAPHVSEKASRAQEKNQFVFKVAVSANKGDIKIAVEKLFEVKVESVKVLNVVGKKKRFGQFTGQRKHWKKAYVRLEKGQSIELFETE